MDFYTINYIQNHQNTDRTALYILMIVAASAMIIFAILYLRDRDCKIVCVRMNDSLNLFL